jgi:hypothetical protein
MRVKNEHKFLLKSHVFLVSTFGFVLRLELLQLIRTWIEMIWNDCIGSEEIIKRIISQFCQGSKCPYLKFFDHHLPSQMMIKKFEF